MHGVFSHGFDQQEVINAILNGLGIVFGSVIAKLVISRAPLIVDIRVGMALTLPLVVALDATDGFFLEFIHVQDEKRHGYCSGVNDSSKPEKMCSSPRIFSGFFERKSGLLPACSTASAFAGSPISLGGSMWSLNPLL